MLFRSPSKWTMRIEVVCNVEASSQAEAKKKALDLFRDEKFDMFRLRHVAQASYRCITAKAV